MYNIRRLEKNNKIENNRLLNYGNKQRDTETRRQGKLPSNKF